MNKKTIIIVAVVAVVVIGAFIYWKRAKRQSAENKAFADYVQGVIPESVLKEPTKDWEGETLTVNGVKYTPVNGVWTIVK